MATVVEIDDDEDWAEAEVKRPNPHFFKVLVGDYTQRMKIPPKFVKYLQEDMTSKASSSSKPAAITASIEGPTGRTWYAELEKTISGVCFTTGWPNFVRDHSLEEHELLVFRYNGFMSFTVLIFDKTACEKKDPEVGSGNERSKARLKPRKLAFCEDNLGDQLKAKEKSGPSIEPKVTETDTEDKEGMNAVQNSSRKRKKASEMSRRVYRISSRMHPITENEKWNTQETAYSFVLENPFFVIRMSASAVYGRSMQLKLPTAFSKKHLPRHKTDVILHVSANSKTWSVAFHPYLSGNDRFSRGWSSFVWDNSLEEYDYCAFELVKSADFLVHIIRVSEVQLLSASRARKNTKV